MKEQSADTTPNEIAGKLLINMLKPNTLKQSGEIVEPGAIAPTMSIVASALNAQQKPSPMQV